MTDNDVKVDVIEVGHEHALVEFDDKDVANKESCMQGHLLPDAFLDIATCQVDGVIHLVALCVGELGLVSA